MELSYIITFSGWFLGGFVNIVTGMGGPMIALPLMVLFMDFSLVILVACLLSVLTNILLVIRFWHYTDWKAVWMLVLGSLPGVGLGVWSLKHIPAFGLEIFLGSMLIAFAVWQMWGGLNLRGSWGDGVLARLGWGAASGMFTGAVGLGGPPMAVCASMAGWDKNVARAIFGAFFMFSISIAVIFDILYGLVTPVVMQHTLVGLPGVLLGTLVGLPAARKIRQETFRRSMMWIVLLGAISLLFKAFLH